MNLQPIIISEQINQDRENDSVQIDVGKVAVFIHLHYLDTLEIYFQFIDIIPNNVNIYISTSNANVKKIIQDYILKKTKKKIKIIVKKNRGRDITAFLVVFREIMLQYKYICFLHDKKEKRTSHKKDVQLWINNLWGNLLGTKNSCYFWKIISQFEKNDKLGLLAPPEPIGASFSYENAWNEPYISLTRELANDLDIHVNIQSDIDHQPLTLGTCFWARKDALLTVLGREWNYEDFEDEPIPIGAKCYAIERILGYVAEDAGYHVYQVMSEEYAGKYIRFLMESRRRAFKELDRRYAITTLYELKSLDRMCRYFDAHEIVYLYGAGRVGKGLCTYLRDTDRYPAGFIVTEETSERTCLSIPVKNIDEICHEKYNIGIIISVAGGNVAAIMDELLKRNVTDYIYITQ